MIEEFALYDKRVRMCLLRWSGYTISDAQIDYIIAKSKFREVLLKDPNILNITPQQTATTILYTAALDLKKREEK